MFQIPDFDVKKARLELYDPLIELETFRKSAHKCYLFFIALGVVFGLSIAGTTYFIFQDALSRSKDAPLLFVLPLVTGGLSFLGFKSLMANPLYKNFENKFREMILNRFVPRMFPEIQYELRGTPEKAVQDSKLIEEYYYHLRAYKYESEDLLRGRIQGCNASVSDMRVSFKLGKNAREVFSGIFLAVELRKRRSGRVIAVHAFGEGALNLFGENTNWSTNRSNAKAFGGMLGIPNREPVFGSEQHRIFADNAPEAYESLTPELDAFCRRCEQLFGQTRISLQQNFAYATIQLPNTVYVTTESGKTVSARANGMRPNFGANVLDGSALAPFYSDVSLRVRLLEDFVAALGQNNPHDNEIETEETR